MSQTITLVNTYTIHKSAGNTTGANYYFDTCQEMSLVNCKALNWSANASLSGDCFYFKDCRGVVATGISGGGTQGAMIRILSSSVGYSQGLYFYGTTIEACTTAVYIEGTTGPHYVQDVHFYGVRKQEGVWVPPITTGGFVLKNLIRGMFDIPAFTCTMDAACSDVRVHVQDGPSCTVDPATIRPHIDADLDLAAAHFNRTLYESLALMSLNSGGPELLLGVRGRLDHWRFFWSANATPADFGLQLRYVDAAGVGHLVIVSDALGAVLRLYAPADAEIIRMSTDLVSLLGKTSRKTIANITASTTQTQGQGQLTADINEVRTVANANDTVTLPAAVAGLEVVIINNGANTLRVYPASGDDLGAGVNNPTTQTTGVNRRYAAFDSTTWEVI